MGLFTAQKAFKVQSNYELTMEDILKKWKYSSQWPSVMCHSSLDRYLPGDKEYGEFDRGFETVRGAASAPRFQTALRAFGA